MDTPSRGGCLPLPNFPGCKNLKHTYSLVFSLLSVQNGYPVKDRKLTQDVMEPGQSSNFQNFVTKRTLNRDIIGELTSRRLRRGDFSSMAMFESLSKRLEGVFTSLSGKGKLTEADVDEAMREVRLALLEADVSLKLVRQFVERVKAKAVG